MSSDCNIHTNAEDANFDRCSICAHERIRELEAERLEHAALMRQATEQIDGFNAHVPRLLARIRDLEAALRGFKDDGLRFDLNPTHDLRYAATEEGRAAAMWWHDYIRRMDQSVRERAASALETKGDGNEG